MIEKYLTDNRISADGMSNEQLMAKLEDEMFGLSFLTKYIYGKGIEEININSWKDIEVSVADNARLQDNKEYLTKEIERLESVRNQLKRYNINLLYTTVPTHT